MANYTKYTFSMFGGEVQNVELVFQNRMMGAAMDRFGRDIVPMRVDDNHFRIVVPVAVSQQFFAWVFGLGNSVRIAGPESVKEQMNIVGTSIHTNKKTISSCIDKMMEQAHHFLDAYDQE